MGREVKELSRVLVCVLQGFSPLRMLRIVLLATLPALRVVALLYSTA